MLEMTIVMEGLTATVHCLFIEVWKPACCCTVMHAYLPFVLQKKTRLTILYILPSQHYLHIHSYTVE